MSAASGAPARAWLTGVGLMALVFFVLWPFRSAGLVADDIFFVRIYHFTSWSDLLLGPWPHPFGATSGWRPLALVSYLLSEGMSGENPAGYRAFGYALHGAASALLAALVSGLARRRATGVVAGALFAVHPIVNESVIWISGRTYPLAAVFALGLCVWTLGHDHRSALRQHVVGAVLFAGALASYEFAVVVPIVLAAMCVLRSQGSWRSACELCARRLWPYLVILALYLCFRWMWITTIGADVLVSARASQWAPGVGTIGWRVARNTLYFSLRLLAWPRFDGGSDVSAGLTAVVSAAVFCTATLTLLLRSDTRKMGLFWLAWIGIFFLPVIAFSGFSDRYGYLSAAGIAAIVAVAAITLWDASNRWRYVPAVAVTLVFLQWSHALRDHGSDWVAAGRTAEAIVEEVLRHEPSMREPLDLHFVGIPRRDGSAFVFITYFPHAVLLRYPEGDRASSGIYMSWDPVASLITQLEHTPAPRRVKVYEWVAPARTLVLRWERSPDRPAS